MSEPSTVSSIPSELVTDLILATETLLPECPIVTHHPTNCRYCAVVESRKAIQEYALNAATESQERG
jgi:hypothetical protein